MTALVFVGLAAAIEPGSLDLRMHVATGKVSAQRVDASSGTLATAQDCVLATVSSWEFPTDLPELDLLVSFEVTGIGGTSYTLGHAVSLPASAGVPAQQAVSRAVEGALSGVRACVDAGTPVDVDRAGGDVAAITVRSTRIPNCAEEATALLRKSDIFRRCMALAEEARGAGATPNSLRLTIEPCLRVAGIGEEVRSHAARCGCNDLASLAWDSRVGRIPGCQAR